MENPLINEFREHLFSLRREIEEAAREGGHDPDRVRILAATKTVDTERINAAIKAGFTLIGENRVQELQDKYDEYDPLSEKHFIGALQTNKVKYIVDKVSLIHSVDSERLAAEIDKRSGAIKKVMDVLVEVNIGGEDTKSGIRVTDTADFCILLSKYPNIRVRGLMCIPPPMPIDGGKYEHFANMYHLFIDIRDKNMDNVNMDILSMGMSGDYREAVKNGANLIRLGTALFGKRNVLG